MGHHRHHRHHHRHHRHHQNHHVWSKIGRGLKKAFKFTENKIARPLYKNVIKPVGKEAISLGKNTLDREQRLFILATNPTIVLVVAGVAALILLRK